MKVRLKHEFAFNSQKYALLFQFHEGPIKTPFTAPYILFKMVSIP